MLAPRRSGVPVLVPLLVFAALIGSSALSQELTTGTLEGTVIAQDTGDPIEGVVVTAVGPQGVRSAVTDEMGRYVIPGLVSGSYVVRCECPGYATFIQSEVAVKIGTRTQLPFSLPAGLVEEVTVTSEAPVVDMKSTGTGQAIRIDDVAPYIPIGRNIVSTFALAPGVTDGGDVGEVNRSISGSSGLENVYFIDGVNITNSGYGALGAYSLVYGSLGTGVTYEFLEEIQVKTGGFEPEYGQAGGGVVNAVVKSGTNRFTADLAWYETAAGLEGNRSDRVLDPNRPNKVDESRRDLALAVGGPVLRDRLFYFVAYNPIWTNESFKLTSGNREASYFLEDTNGDGVLTDTDIYGDDGTVVSFADQPLHFVEGATIRGGRVPETVARERRIDNYASKVSWFVTPSQKLELTAFGDPSEGDIGPNSPADELRTLADPLTTPDPQTSATGIDWGGNQASFRHQAVWGASLFSEFLAARKEADFLEFGPGAEYRRFTDVATQVSFGGAGFLEDFEDIHEQWSLKLTHVLGPVELRYGAQYEDIRWRQEAVRSGPTFTAYIAHLVDGTPIDEDGDGVADRTGLGLLGSGRLDDPASYLPFETATGAHVDVYPDYYDVVRGGIIGSTRDFTEATETNVFAQLTWEALPNLTVKAGVRGTRQDLRGSGEVELPLVTVQNLATSEGTTCMVPLEYRFEDEWSPRVGVSWDVLADGRHKLYANYGEYVQRVPSDLAARAFSPEAGLRPEYDDAGLTTPRMNSSCWTDADGNGIHETVVDCHLIRSSISGETSLILDGTQLVEGSAIHDYLGPYTSMVTGETTRLPYTEEWLAGYAWQIDDYTSLELRYIDRDLGRLLEDVQFASNEQTWNGFFGTDGAYIRSLTDPFPGHGAAPFGAYVLANVGENISSELFPVAVRDYQALEFVFNRRFRDGWMAYANYRLAKLEGNYEGTFRNDNGQSDPFITSLWDFPGASAVDSDGDGTIDRILASGTVAGQFLHGPLNTERTHVLNAFVSRQWPFGLNAGLRLALASGVPMVPLLAHPTYRNSGEIPGSEPSYWWLVLTDVTGDGAPDGFGVFTDTDAELAAPYPQDFDGDGALDEPFFFVTGPRLHACYPARRGDLGHTPATLTLDLHLGYDLSLGIDGTLSFLLDVFNVFDETEPLAFDHDLEIRPGVPNLNYMRANRFPDPRTVRLGMKYTW